MRGDESLMMKLWHFEDKNYKPLQGLACTDILGRLIPIRIKPRNNQVELELMTKKKLDSKTAVS